MTYTYSSRTVFVLGAARSGTTWLAKIFDSHPDVIYRHEPDRLHEEFPFWLDADETPNHLREAEIWLDMLAETRNLRASGKTPLFKKSFESPIQNRLKRCLVATLKAAGRIPGGDRLLQSCQIPDFVELDSDNYKKIVIKSIASLARTSALALAAPDSHFILIFRHPCGQVASMVQGVRLSHFERRVPVRMLAKSPQARRHSLSAERLANLSLPAQLAWSWVIHNEKAMEDLRQARHLTIVRYEDLAADPEGVARRLFAATGLDWQEQTTHFLGESADATGEEGYYEVRRNSADAAKKWQQQLTAAEIDQICAIAAESEPGRLFISGRKGDALSVVISGNH